MHAGHAPFFFGQDAFGDRLPGPRAAPSGQSSGDEADHIRGEVEHVAHASFFRLSTIAPKASERRARDFTHRYWQFRIGELRGNGALEHAAYGLLRATYPN